MAYTFMIQAFNPKTMETIGFAITVWIDDRKRALGAIELIVGSELEIKDIREVND